MGIEALLIHKRSDVLIHAMWCIGLEHVLCQRSEIKGHT